MYEDAAPSLRSERLSATLAAGQRRGLYRDILHMNFGPYSSSPLDWLGPEQSGGSRHSASLLFLRLFPKPSQLNPVKYLLKASF